jgi:hypothetical protein
LSKSKSLLQQYSLFSFVVDGKHIVDEIGTKPRDRLPVLPSLTINVHYPFNRSQASSDGTLGIVLDVSTEFAWCRSFVCITGGWTQETMNNATVDNFLKELHVAIEQNPQALAPQLSRY